MPSPVGRVGPDLQPTPASGAHRRPRRPRRRRGAAVAARVRIDASDEQERRGRRADPGERRSPRGARTFGRERTRDGGVARAGSVAIGDDEARRVRLTREQQPKVTSWGQWSPSYPRRSSRSSRSSRSRLSRVRLLGGGPLAARAPHRGRLARADVGPRFGQLPQQQVGWQVRGETSSEGTRPGGWCDGSGPRPRARGARTVASGTATLGYLAASSNRRRPGGSAPTLETTSPTAPLARAALTAAAFGAM